MIKTRRSARQNRPNHSVVYYCPDKPVKPIGQTVDKNYEFLTKTPWRIRNLTKQTVYDSEFEQGRHDQNKLKCSKFDILQQTPIELKPRGGPLDSYGRMPINKKITTMTLRSKLHTHSMDHIQAH